MKLLSAIVALALVPSAACSSTRTAELYYPPRDTASSRPIPAAFVRPGAPAFVVDDFEDRRRWQEIGGVRTRLRGRQHVRLLSDQPIEDWVRDGVAAEFQRAGLEAVVDGEPGADALHLSGRVHEAYSERRHYYEGTVLITGIARCGCHGKILLSRKYLGTTTLPLDVEAQDPHAEVLSRALQRAAQLLASDAATLSPCP